MTTISLQELPPETAAAIKRALAGGEDVLITGDKEEHLARLVSVQGELHAIGDALYDQSSDKIRREFFDRR